MSAILTTTSSFARPARAAHPRVSALAAFIIMAAFSAGLWFGIARLLMWAAAKV